MEHRSREIYFLYDRFLFPLWCQGSASSAAATQAPEVVEQTVINGAVLTSVYL